jgi:hypothetical protein
MAYSMASVTVPEAAAKGAGEMRSATPKMALLMRRDR